MGRRHWLLLMVLMVPLAGAGAVPTAPHPIQPRAAVDLTSFLAVASADGVRVGVSAAAAPLTSQPVDLGLPVAQALANGLGTSQAFAAMPYPGDVAISLPSTLVPIVGATLGAPLPPAPAYPLMAASDVATRPEASASQPGVTLTAKSEALASRANAVAGGESGANAVGRTAATAAAVADATTGQITAESASTNESVTLEGVLRLGRVRATARVVVPAGADPRTESALEVEGATIAGVTFAVTDKGIVLPGSGAPVPDTSGLNPVLDGAGITLRYLAPTVSDGSVVSAGLQVAERQTLPSVGESVVTYTFGRARASASGSATLGSPATGVDLPPVATGGDASTLGDSNLRADRGFPAVDSHAGSGEGVVARPTATPPAVAVEPVATSTASAASFYLVLVLGAVVAASGFVLIRIFGVRLAWTS